MGDYSVQSLFTEFTDIYWYIKYSKRPFPTRNEMRYCPVHLIYWEVDTPGDFNCPVCNGDITMWGLLPHDRLIHEWESR
jgi:hypothetical protein